MPSKCPLNTEWSTVEDHPFIASRCSNYSNLYYYYSDICLCAKHVFWWNIPPRACPPCPLTVISSRMSWLKPRAWCLTQSLDVKAKICHVSVGDACCWLHLTPSSYVIIYLSLFSTASYGPVLGTHVDD